MLSKLKLSFIGLLLAPLLVAANVGTVIAEDNLIPNPSVESSVNGAPTDWNQGYLWGDLDADYQYITSGYQSSHALQVTVSRINSGDAKWYFAPQPVVGGQSYRFSDHYHATSPTEVVVMSVRADGSASYISIGSAPAAAVWSVFTGSFTVPLDAQSISVFHLINRVGTLVTDEFSLIAESGTSNFTRGLVSVTFDDGWKSVHDVALPLLNQHSITSTQYIASGLVGTTGYMSRQDILDFSVSGHEIASHSVNHLDLTQLSPKRLNAELKQSKIYLERLTGKTVTAFAAPYGAYNDTTINQIKRYYRSQRTSDVGFNTRVNFNRYQLRSQYITPQTTLAEFQSWLDTAMTDKSWLIVMYHNVDESGSAYSVSPAMLAQQLATVNAVGITAKTVSDALTELEAQL